MTPPSRFYSTHGEDSIAAGFFKYAKKGFFLEIGAMDGLRMSNTYYLEQLGWRGMCIEAHPKYAEMCIKNRPRSINIHAAVADKIRDSVDFFAAPAGAASSINEKFAKKIFRKHHQNPKELVKTQVPMVTVDFVLKLHRIKKVDYVSVDVEGTEAAVMRGFSVEKYKPRLIILEQCFLVDSPKIIEYMKSRGYHFARKIAINAFYCRDQKDVKLVRSIKPKKTKPFPHPLHGGK
jgi:FkbM family methyltransferase